jgi:hypothetical protein
MEPLVLYQKKWKLLALTLFSLAMTAFCLALVTGMLDLDTKRYYTTLLYLGLPFFTLCSLYFLYRLWQNKPALILDEKGIWNNVVATDPKFIAWDEIKHITIYPYKAGGTIMTLIGIVPTDYSPIYERQSRLKKIMFYINSSFLGQAKLKEIPIMNIPENALPISADELAQEIAKRAQLHRESSLK